MALKITKTDVWAVEIQDQPGGLAKIMQAIAAAGADLQCVIARRQPDKPGTGVVFVSPLAGDKVRAAASAAGFRETQRVASLRVEGPDQPGLGARMTQTIGQAGVNLRGISALALGRKFVAYLGFDSAADADKAAAALEAWAGK